MVKPSKSSASSNTRKKHAKKSTNPEDQPPEPQPQKKQRGQKLTKAQKKALPKIKQYIPPPKPPAPPIPDPLDGQGLARSLPAELVVVLRRLGKKDDVTRRKGLEELREGWVGDLVGEKGDEFEREMKEMALLAAIPVWMHNLASLLQSPFHRTTALQLHNDLLSIPSIQTSIIETLQLSLLPGTQNRDILGSWLVSSLEEGRRSGGAGIKVWEESTTFSVTNTDSEASSSSSKIDLTPQISTLIEYLSLSILDPATLHEDIHPPPISINSGTSSPAPSARVLAKSTKVRPSSLATPTTSSPANEEDEVEVERWARYRVAGLTGLSWLIQRLSTLSFPITEELRGLLRNPVLWSSLSSLESAEVLDHFPSEGGSLGWQQPPIRRAGYTLLGVLIDSYPKEVEEMLELLSVGVLSSCWLEKEGVVWESAGSGVVKFLSKYRTSWEIAMDVEGRRKGPDDPEEKEGGEEGGDEEDEGDDSDEDDEADVEEAKAEETIQDVSSTSSTNSTSFTNLLSFIATTCPTIPHLTYPLLLVIISTLPSSLLPLAPTTAATETTTPSAQLSNLLSHLWSPFDAKLLSTHSLPNALSTFQSFLTSAIDVTTYLIGKSFNTPEGRGTAQWLVSTQLGERVWKDGILGYGGKGRVRVNEEREKEAIAFGGALERVYGVDKELGEEVARIVRVTLLEACFAEGSSVLIRSLGLLAALRKSTANDAIHTGIDECVVEIAGGCYERLERDEGFEVPLVETLVEILKTHPVLLDKSFIEKLVNVIINRIDIFALALPSTTVVSLISLVFNLAPPETQVQARQAFWGYLDHSNASQKVRLEIVNSLLAAESSVLLANGVLDTISVEATQTALGGEGESSLAGSVASSSIRTQYISQDALHTILALVSTSIHDSVTESLSTPGNSNIEAPLTILLAYAKGHISEIVRSDIYSQALVGVYHLVHVLPRVDGGVPSETAVEIWGLGGQLSDGERATVDEKVGLAVAGLLGSVTCRVDPGILLDAASATSNIDLKSLLPSTPELLSQLRDFTSQSPHPSLPIVDTLIPYAESYESKPTRSSDFDASGRSSLARYIQAILIMLRTDRKLALEQPDLLRVALGGMMLAKDAVAVPNGSRGLYATSTPTSLLQDTIRDTEGILSYTLSSFDDLPLSWHSATIQKLKTATKGGDDDFLQNLLGSLRDEIVASGGDVESRVFRDVLSRIMRESGSGEKEGEAWLGYAMSLVDKAQQLALAIILAIKPLIQDSKAFSLSQNRLASALTTIPTSQISSTGIPYLRLLTSTAPPPDAASLFIPQQRAIFVLKHVGGWLVDEDDTGMSEDVEWRVLELYATLTGVVQDLQGGHWDSIFDLVENGLEASSLDDVTTHCLLYQSLVVLQQIRDLSASNKSLKASWTSRDVHMGLILKLFLQCRDADSLPLQMIQSLILDLLNDVPETIRGQASMKQLCDLLKFSKSSPIQCAAYKVLNQVIKQHTLVLVLQVEASVAEAEDGHAVATIELPSELLGVVENGRAVVWETSSLDFILAQLLAWLAILDHFEDASTSLRWAYVDQLTSGKLLNESLLPMLFAMLGVSEMGAWNFPASQYAVDEFYPDLLLPEDVADLVPLASHLFYRSLVTIPSAMRTYYESLKDRQLSLSLLTFTTKHYSPTIISHELSTLRQPAALATLTEEGLNVKIISGGGGITSVGTGGAEAIASYVVDEQPMEIGIRLPAEFPLRGVDVRDLRRVGVPENKWRGWLMSVQQTITSRNGLIMEALTVFKRNVSLHFEGVVECAICYSIISLTDRTLPTKPCRTCKNRFHASCLFKWFNSSHSSSCPLCRSLF